MVSSHAFVLALALTGASDSALLEFSADWCGACKMMAPTVERLRSEGFDIRKVDVEKQKNLAQQFQITAVPSFVLVSDGRVVDRVVGVASYDRLKQMLAKVPAPAAANRSVVRGQSPPKSGLNIPNPLALLGGSKAPNPESERTPPPDPHHGATPNHPGRQQANGDPAAVALAATVRIRVNDPVGSSVGTGTMIDTHGDEALIVTCGHIFRDSKGKGQISVDLFGESPRTVKGTLIGYDLERDVALVSMVPERQVQTVPVASKSFSITKGMQVFTVGCSKGAAPTVERSHMAAIDKYLGPSNFEVAGQPVDGRSGGGLFAADGTLIGVCNAADPQDNEGIYAGLPSVHWQLDQIGQQAIYQRGGPGSAPAAAAAVATNTRQHVAPVAATIPASSNPANSNPTSSNPAGNLLGAGMGAASIGGAAVRPAALSQGSELEVICIVRSRSNPTGGDQLYVLDRPSPELLQQLRQESSNHVRPLSDFPRTPVVRAQSADQ